MLGGYSRVDATGRPNAELRPEFFMDAVLDEAATAASGRPIYRDIESVKIIVPGLTATVVVHRVNQTHVTRWPEAYAAFRQGLDQPIRGTPIEAWCLMTPAQVKTLRAREIRTIEELATISDNAVSQLGMGGMMLRQHARAYLDDAHHEAFRTQLVAENDGLRAEVAGLKHMVDELNRNFARMADENRRWAEDAHLRRSYAEGPAGYPLPTPPAPNGYGGYGGQANSGHPNGGYQTPPTDPYGGGAYAPAGSWGGAAPADPFAALARVPVTHRAPPALAEPSPAVPEPPNETPRPAYPAPQQTQRPPYEQNLPPPAAYPPPPEPAPEYEQRQRPAYPPPPDPRVAGYEPGYPPAGSYAAPPPPGYEQNRNPPPPWGYGNHHEGTGAPPPGPDVRTDLHAEMARHGVVGEAVAEDWVLPGERR